MKLMNELTTTRQTLTVLSPLGVGREVDYCHPLLGPNFDINIRKVGASSPSNVVQVAKYCN